MATTGMNTSIPPGDTMSAVHSSVTTASDSWQEHFTQVCNNHSEVIQEAQPRCTHDMLEQIRENDKRYQKVQDFLVDNSRALSASLDRSMDQVSGCQAEIQGFTSNVKRAQRKLEHMIGNLCHAKDHPHHH